MAALQSLTSTLLGPAFMLYPTLGTEPVGRPGSQDQLTPCFSSWKLKSTWRQTQLVVTRQEEGIFTLVFPRPPG